MKIREISDVLNTPMNEQCNSSSNIDDNINNETIKGIKILSTADMITFLDYYMTHSFEEIKNKYYFDKKYT